MEVRPYSYFQWCGYFSGYHLLRQMSSQCGSQKLLQGLVSHELTAYFSIFNLFKFHELWPYQKHVNQIILNCLTLSSLALRIFEAFIRILLIPNLSFNQTLLTFLFCETDLNDSIDSESCSLCERRSFFCIGLISRKLSGLLLVFSTGFTSCSVFLLFPVSITFFVIVHGFWFCFI